MDTWQLGLIGATQLLVGVNVVVYCSTIATKLRTMPGLSPPPRVITGHPQKEIFQQTHAGQQNLKTSLHRGLIGAIWPMDSYALSLSPNMAQAWHKVAWRFMRGCPKRLTSWGLFALIDAKHRACNSLPNEIARGNRSSWPTLAIMRRSRPRSQS